MNTIIKKRLFEFIIENNTETDKQLPPMVHIDAQAFLRNGVLCETLALFCWSNSNEKCIAVRAVEVDKNGYDTYETFVMDFEVLPKGTQERIYSKLGLAYKTTREEIADALEDLVHNRYSKAQVEKYINDLFNPKEPITIDWDCYQDGGLTDYDAMFSTWSDDIVDEELIGDFDLYWLPLKADNEEQVEVYITEVAYDFHNL